MAIKIKNSSGVEEIITLYATTAEMNGTGISTSRWLPVSKSGVTYYAGLIPESLSTPPEAVAMKSSLKVYVGGVTYAVAFASKQATTSTNGAVIPATADNRGFLLQYSITGARGAGAAGAQGGGGAVEASNPVNYAYMWYGVGIAGGGGTAGANSAVPTTSSRASSVLTTSEANQWIGSTVAFSSSGATAATSATPNIYEGYLFTYKLASAPGNVRYSVGPGAAAKDSAPGAGGSSSSLTTSGGYTVTASGTSGGSGTSNRSGTQTIDDTWVVTLTGSPGGAGGGLVGGEGQFANFYMNYVNFPLTTKSGGAGGASTGNGGAGGTGGYARYSFNQSSGLIYLDAQTGIAGSDGAAGAAGSASYTATYWIKGAY